MNDKKKNIDTFFGSKLKDLAPSVKASDWEAIAAKKANSPLPLSEKLKNITAQTNEADWLAIQAKMSTTPQKRMMGWLWVVIPLLVVSALVGYYLKENNQYPTNIELVNHELTERNTANSTKPIEADKLNKAHVEKDIAPASSSTLEQKTKINKGYKLGDKKYATNTRGRKKSKYNSTTLDNTLSATAPPTKQKNRLQIALTSKNDLILYVHASPEALNPLPTNVDKSQLPKNIGPEISKTVLSNFSISPFVSANKYQAHFTSEDPLFEQYRNAAEKAIVLPEMGIKINGDLGKTALNTGLVYSLKGQKIDGLINYQLYDSIPHYSQHGEIIGYFRLNYRDTSAQLKVNNTLSYIDIPLNIGYGFNLGQKHMLTPQIGTTLSFFLKAKGQSIAPNIGLHDISSDLFDYRKFITSAQIQLTYGYKISNKIQIESHVQYRNMLHNVYGNNYNASEKLNNFGLSLGLNYKF